MAGGEASDAPNPAQTDVAVALSGGGHRAALFGLGALLYLADAGVNRRVASIASVSGGSMANGYVAQEVDYRAADAESFSDVIAPLAYRLCQGGTLFASGFTRLYLGVLGLTGLSTFATWLLPLGCLLRLGAFVAAVLLWASVVAGARGRVCARAFRTVLYSRAGRPTLLSDIHGEGVTHVFCATDLQAGEQVYFSDRFVCSYRLGWGSPAELYLADAVQASACLPGAFPPRYLPVARHRFAKGALESLPRWMVLSDGGVYDNMADQWTQGLAQRAKRWPDHAGELAEPHALVVVNASAGLGFQRIARHAVPALGELFSLLRVKDILYDLTTSQRRSGMVGRFDRAELEDKGLHGALVHIPQSPFVVAQAFQHRFEDWPERAERAAEVLVALGDTEAEWAAIAASSPKVKTTLASIDAAAAAQLLRHGYVLAMANTHVVLDFPLLEVPSKTRFSDLIAQGSQAIGA